METVNKNSASEIGEIRTFYALINEPDSQIEIPVIQRDYAQGRDSSKSIREELTKDLLGALTGEGKPVFLDCVYGSQSEKKFIPIDGQQRLTTLFLLHWYIAVRSSRENRNNAMDKLKNFTYTVRDSAREFCEFLTQSNPDINDNTDKLSFVIRKEHGYHPGIFDDDPTVKGMLVMLDEIHNQLRSMDSMDYNDLFGKLYANECPIRFQWLKIENFGDDDDLFIKLNARGKKLTMFERFKSDIEKNFNERGLSESQLCKVWIDKIDNDWLSWFWDRAKEAAPDISPAEAESEMFRFILFAAYVLHNQQNDDKLDWNANQDISSVNFDYDYAVDALMNGENLKRIVSMLDALPRLYGKLFPDEVGEDFELVISANAKSDYKSCARLYTVLSFFISDISKSLFGEYYRVLKNLITAYREYQKRDTLYRSYFDQKTIGVFTAAIDELIQCIYDIGSINKAIIASNIKLRGFDNEKEKAKYIEKNGAKEVEALEKVPELCGLIHNFLFDDKIWLDASGVRVILENKMKFLQLVQIKYKYSPREKWHVSTKWGIEAYLWRYWMGVKSEYGDIVLTYDNNDCFRDAVRDFIREIGSNKTKTISDILNEQRKNIVFGTDWWDYIGKYDEFFADKDSICCKEFYKNGDRPYHQVVCAKATRGSDDGAWNEGKYNPFCKALANKLGLNNPIFNGEHMEILDLNNGSTIRIEPNGGWVYSYGINEEKIVMAGDRDIIEQAEEYLKNKGVY